MIVYKMTNLFKYNGKPWIVENGKRLWKEVEIR